MRKSIRQGDPWTIRLWLTYFQLYRVIDVPGKVKLQTITAPSTMSPEFLSGWINFLNRWLPFFFREVGRNRLANQWMLSRSSGENPRIANGIDTSDMIGFVAQLAAKIIPFDWEGIPCNLKPRLLALFKGGPNTGGVHETSWVDGRAVTKKVIVRGKVKRVSCLSATNTGAIFTDIMQWMDRPVLFNYLKEWLDIVGDRTIDRILFVGKRVINFYESKRLAGESFNRFKYPGFGRPHGLGKLGYKIEPAGKIRVFAMVDSLTQCVMKPLHDLLFSLLRKIETDGTFDQIRPAQRLINAGYTSFWSLDLSAATDRFPLALQQALLSVLIGPRLAELWARILVEREYTAPAYLPNGKVAHGTVGDDGLPCDLSVKYGAGQPMGALTSWAAFSLCHHCLVQYAAYRALGLVGFFKEYALLGDDIVIANHAVALAYQALLLEIGVEYGLAKSLISSTGGFEFAKRTFARGKDVSGISLLAVGVAKADHAVLEQILTRFGTDSTLMETLRRAAKVLGYGYRSVARLPAVLSAKSRLQGLAILLSRPGSPWGLEVIQWLLQWQPGVQKDVPQDVLLAIGERLWDSLKASTEASIERHLEGLAKVITPDSTYGGNVDVWFDESSLHEHSWNVYIVIPLIADLKIELRDLKKELELLSRPNLDDLNEIWARIDAIKDAIAAIPSVPNFFERNRQDFGGAKRSALIKVFRKVRVWLNTELALNLNQRCLATEAMAMGLELGTDLVVKHEDVVETGTPMESDGTSVRDQKTLPPEGPLIMLSPRIGFVVTIVMTPAGPIPSRTYVCDGVPFTENDIHLDGILHNETMSYALVLDHLLPDELKRVKERLREQQLDEIDTIPM
jgi:hypothetical protein